MNALRIWLTTVIVVMATLMALAQLADGGIIYNIDGMFGTSFVNDVSSNFKGTMEFPGTTVQNGVLKLQIEADPGTTREVPFSMALNLPASLFQPWDTRLFAGIYDGKPVTMFAVDYDQVAGQNLDPALLDDGGGWDVWAVSFNDWTAGSIDTMDMAIVNEPAALSLGAVGFVLVLGVMRMSQRR